MGVLPKCHEQSPWQGRHNDFFKITFEEPHGITTYRTTSYEADMLCPTQRSREATPDSDKEASSNVTAHCAQEGVKGGNKRRKHCLQGTMSMTCHDDGHGWEVGGSDARRVSTTVHSGKLSMRPPTDHIKRLLKEAYPNHTYPIRHNFKDCGMMRSFITSRSLTCVVELDEGLNGSDTTSVPEENAFMIVYGGCPPSGRHRMSSLSPRAPTRCSSGHGGSGV
jgi:hypothetical protein